MPTKISHKVNTAEFKGTKITEVLVCYASGDGAMHFTWAKTDYPRTCTRRSVTLKDVIDYIASDEAAHLVKSGWHVWQRGPYANGVKADFHLVAPIKRIDANTLELDGKQYSVEVEFRDDDKTVIRSTIIVKTETGTIGTVRVMNASTLASLAHFIDHEQELPPL